MTKLILYWLAWSLGWNESSATTSSGFGSDQLVPTRMRNNLEAMIRLFSTLLFFIVIGSSLTDWLNPLVAPDRYWLALPAALWALQTIFRPSVPMDSASISTGLWCFAPYLPFFLINPTDIPLFSLLWQMGGFIVLLTFGLARDIRKETKSDAA